MRVLNTLLLFAAILLLNINITYAQTLDTDASGKSTLILQGASAMVDVPRAYFGASYYKIPDDKYFRRSSIFGFNASGTQRNGVSGLLNNGLDAVSYKAYFTGGWVFTSEYPAKLKSISEYEAMLKEEQEYWQQDSLQKLYDTAFIFNQIDKIATSHPKYTDSLKIIYFESGPTKTTILEWLNYASRVKEREGDKNFYANVEQLTVDLLNTFRIENYKKSLKYLNRINIQLDNIKLPAQPFSQTNFFFDLGMSGTSFNQATFEPINNKLDSIPIFARNTVSNLYLAMGVNYISSNKLCIGLKVGVTANDNFEQLTPLQYDTTKLFNGGRGQVTQSYTGYNGTYTNTIDPFFSASFSYIDKLEKLGHIILTPLYFTLSNRSTYGASISIVTKNKVLIGANVEGLNISENAFYEGSEAYSNFTIGFRVGYLLSDFNFVR